MSIFLLEQRTNFAIGDSFWTTKSLPHHGVPALRLSDGPNGVRGGTFFAGTKGAVGSIPPAVLNYF